MKRLWTPAWRSFFALLFISLWIALIVQGQQPPSPKPMDAPPQSFSAMRALLDLKEIAKAPHPILPNYANEKLSALRKERERVQAYLQKRLRSLGHVPKLQHDLVGNTSRRRIMLFAGAKLTNIMVRVKGTKSTGIIAIVAHYDSVWKAPGAGDDGAAVSAMLETLRALQHHPPSKNDLLFLFTDAEEIGLWGAQSFIKKHPWARKVRVVMNFEGRGNAGPSLMFETKPQNGRIIRAFARGDHAPRTTSLFFEVYRRMPNDTDFTIFKKAGVQGLNFGIIEGIRHYHQTSDNIENLSLASLQDHGEHMLSMARTLGQMDLTKIDAPNLVYFDILGRKLMYYPEWLAKGLAIIAVLAFFLLFWLAWKQKKIRIMRILYIFLSYLFSALFIGVLVGVLALQTLRWRGKHLYSFYRDIPHDGLYNIAFLLFAASLFLVTLAFLQRWSSRIEQAFAAMFLWCPLVLSTAFFLTGGSYLFLWPFFGGLILLWLTQRADEEPHTTNFQRWPWWFCELPLYLLGVPLFYHLPYALTLNLMGAFAFLFVFFFSMAWASHDLLCIVGHRWALLCGLTLSFFCYFVPFLF